MKTNFEFIKGDILTSDVEALVNTVNCVGVMGRGIALQFKKAFPENYKKYSTACKLEEVQPGKMFITKTDTLVNPKFIVNFPTKRHWRGKSKMEDIESGLEVLAEEIRRLNIKSIAIPPLGSGLGGLDWEKVKPKIVNALNKIQNIRVIIYEPSKLRKFTPSNISSSSPDMTPGRAALVGLIKKYSQGLLDPFVSLLEVHKLMYFMQTAGQELKLKFVKSHYGPYAENLRHVLNTIEGHFISGYFDGGDSPTKQLKLVPGIIDDATNVLKENKDTQSRFEKVADLVSGFESPFGLELLATVHWVATHENPNSTKDIITKIHSWSDRKKRFTPRQIDIAYETLKEKKWLN